MSKMTLKQVRDWLANCAESCTNSSDISNEWCGRMAEALSERIAADEAEVPVAYSIRWASDRRLNLSTVFDAEQEAREWVEACSSDGEVVPLFTHPPVQPPINIAAIREVEFRLAVADALLRECIGFIDHGGAADDELCERIESHLTAHDFSSTGRRSR